MSDEQVEEVDEVDEDDVEGEDEDEQTIAQKIEEQSLRLQATASDPRPVEDYRPS